MQPSLRELQRWLRWAMTDPRGASAAVAGAAPPEADCPERFHEPAPRCLDVIGERSPLSRAERLDIYAEAYFARILDALAADFPRLARTAGDELFPVLVASYLKRHPSRTPNLGEVGRELGAFLAEFAPAREAPWLAELATYEWATTEAFYAPSLPPLDVTSLAAMSERQWQRATFVFDPSLRLLATRFPVHELPDGELAPRDTFLVVHRGGTEAVDADGFRALESAVAGKTLGEVCAAFRDADTARSRFGRWVGAGLIREVRA